MCLGNIRLVAGHEAVPSLEFGLGIIKWQSHRFICLSLKYCWVIFNQIRKPGDDIINHFIIIYIKVEH